MKKWFKCDLGLMTDKGEIITVQDIKGLIKERDKYFQEIERLNNIIDELEKYFAKPNKFIERPERIKILDKLKELKEGK